MKADESLLDPFGSNRQFVNLELGSQGSSKLILQITDLEICTQNTQLPESISLVFQVSQAHNFIKINSQDQFKQNSPVISSFQMQ